MDWKSEAVDKLRGYEARKKSLENIPPEIKRLEGEYAAVRSTDPGRIRVSGGKKDREDALLSNIVIREELKQTLRQAQAWVETADAALSVLDGEQRRVLDLLYIHQAKGNVDRLCDELHLEKASVYRRRDEALRRFTMALYGAVES